MGDTRIIVDASGLLFRYFFALPPLSNSKGEPTGALFGFARFLFGLIEEYNRSKIIIVLDGPDNKRRRRQTYPVYKEQRTEMHPDLLVQINIIPKVCKLFGVPCLAIEGEEADDVISSLVNLFPDGKIDIFSFDKDLCQLVDSRVNVVLPNDVFIRLDYMGVEEKYGVRPDQIPAWLAMVGDSADGLPGVPGLGKKTASDLLKKHDNLENILSSFTNGKRGQTLQEYRDQVLFMERFTHLISSIPIPEIDSISVPNLSALYGWLMEKGFSSLLKYVNPPSLIDESKTEYEVDLSSLALAIQPECLVFFLRFSCLENDILTHGVVVTVSDRVWFWWEDNQSLGNYFFDDLFTIVKEKNGRFVTYHTKEWDVSLLRKGISSLPSWNEDMLLASHLLDGSQDHSLHAILSRFEDGIWMPPLNKKSSAEEFKRHYIALIRFLPSVQDKIINLIKEEELDFLYRNVELPLARLLAYMEFHGVYISIEVTEALSKEIEEETACLVSEIETIVGRQINLHSPKQLSELLFSDLSIASTKKTKLAKLSTRSEVLESLIDEHPIIRLLLRYRKLDKLQNTYLKRWLSLIDSNANRIYTYFDQVGTVTGRLSCKSPNLQNVPSRGELGSRVREAITAPHGYCLLSADYHQMEICLMAHFSKDIVLREAISSGKDIHCLTAAALWDCTEEEVSDENRSIAKTVNFGILYGQTPYGLAKQIGWTVDESEQFIVKYFSKFPHVQTFIEDCKNFARMHGFIRTLLGRKRYIPEINSMNKNVRAMGERFAVNSLIQGSGADLIKLAMLSIQRDIHKEKLNANLVLQVHDELVFEVVKDEAVLLEKLALRNMQYVYCLDVLLRASICIGENWAL